MPKEIIKETIAYTAIVRRMGKDSCLLATHVSLFTAMFVCWQRNGFVQPFSVSRKELMAFSKIASVATYHKCIRELDKNGYIRYQPSYHPMAGSLIYLPGC
jgi:carbamoylphosphate synthase large subunit